MSYTKEIATRVRASVPAAMPNAKLAAALGISAGEFALLLIGKRPFSSVDLVRLGEVLAVDVDWLISGEHGRPKRESALSTLSEDQLERLSRPIDTRELAEALGLLDELDRREKTGLASPAIRRPPQL